MTDNETFKRNRKVLIDDQNKQLFGSLIGESEAIRQQRFTIAQLVRECVDAGFDVVTLVQSLAVGACWLADQSNISRANLAKLVHAVQMPDGVSLTPIVKP